MLTSSSAFAAVFSRPERPPLSLRGCADFSYSRNMWCVWLENLDLDFEFATTCKIQKWFLHWKICLCISFYLSSFENWLKKLLSSTATLHEHTLFVGKKKLQILYRIYKWNSEGNPWNPYLDFLIEIRLEDELFEVEIYFRILLQIRNRNFRK